MNKNQITAINNPCKYPWQCADTKYSYWQKVKIKNKNKNISLVLTVNVGEE